MLRPCLYNIRGNDPHPDCMYFQMHTCSRPCNNDVDRTGYLDDVGQAMLFIEGRDSDIENSLVAKMNELAAEMKFEDAELNRRRLEKIHKSREEYRDKFFSLANFNFVAVLAAASTSRRDVSRGSCTRRRAHRSKRWRPHSIELIFSPRAGPNERVQ